jgi:hypothetical protein
MKNSAELYQKLKNWLKVVELDYVLQGDTRVCDYHSVPFKPGKMVRADRYKMIMCPGKILVWAPREIPNGRIPTYKEFLQFYGLEPAEYETNTGGKNYDAEN